MMTNKQFINRMAISPILCVLFALKLICALSRRCKEAAVLGIGLKSWPTILIVAILALVYVSS